MRDPTRGGAATALCELAERTAFSVELDEEAVPVRPDVRSACDLLGLDPLYCACEGRVLAIVCRDAADEALERMRDLPEGRDAEIIGEVKDSHPGKTVMRTVAGGTRILTKLSGAQLPRIC
jgi:hydrogenase expression/formation protein HypE